MSSDSVFHPRGTEYLNHCNPKKVVVTLGRFNFWVPLRLYAIFRSSGRDLRYQQQQQQQQQNFIDYKYK